MIADASVALVDGPWEHQFVSANGSRFHVATLGPDDGDAPFVVLLHGFPQFWWAWRHQMIALADAGYRVAAIDLRGFGGSDNQPEGYDTPSLVRDVVGVIRSLGESSAVVVGHGLGASIAWSMPGLAPDATRAVAAVAGAHPRIARSRGRSMAGPGVASMFLKFQIPWLPESRLTGSDLVERLLRRWGANPEWISADDAELYRQVMTIPFSAHCSMEYYRWFARSAWRMDGRRWLAQIDDPIAVPVLQVHGEVDRCVRPDSVRADAKGSPAGLVSGPYRFESVAGAGHFVPEETPAELNAILLDWLASL